MAAKSSEAAVKHVRRRLRWKVFDLLMGGALIGILGGIPYSLSLTGPPPSLPIPLWLLLILQIFQNLALVAAATGLGLWLGEKVGLGAPLLQDWLAGESDALARFRALLLPATLAGAVSAVAILVLELGLFAPRLGTSPEIGAGPPLWQGFLASFYGGINEELLLRLGMMTLFVWIGARLTRTARPGAGVMWTANVLAAVLFGLGHLPATAAILPLTSLVVTRAVVLNGLAGVVFGWLYWQRGLLAAMVAHFSADIVLHVLAPFLLVTVLGWTPSAGSGAALTDADREAVLSYAEPMTDNLLAGFNAGDYATFARDFNAKMREALNEAAFEATRTDILGKIGAYVSREVSRIEKQQGLIVVVYTARFEKEDGVTVRVVFEPTGDHRIAGLWFDSPKLRQR